MSTMMQYVSICLIKQLYEVWVGEGGEPPPHKNDQFIIWRKQIVHLILYRIFVTQKHCLVWPNTPANEQCAVLIPDLTQYLNSVNVKPPYILLTPPFAERVVLLPTGASPFFSSFISIQHSINEQSNP